MKRSRRYRCVESISRQYSKDWEVVGGRGENCMQDRYYRVCLTHVWHDILHWLDVPERVRFKLCMTVYKCLHGIWPIYLSEMCRPSSSEAGRRHLRSANRGQLVVSRYRLTTAGRRAFSCAGPSAWNSLPEYLTVDTLTLDYFKRSLKCFLFARYWHSAWSALGICNDSALYT